MSNKNKVTVAALTSMIAMALMGSVTSTIAWYQYSTRANVAYLGSSAGTSGNLQIRLEGDEDWVTLLKKEDIKNYLTDKGYSKPGKPVTAELENRTDPEIISDEDGMVFYSNPNHGVAVNNTYDYWRRAEKGNYISFNVELRYVSRVDKGQGIEDTNIERDVYLTDLLIQQDVADEEEHQDISDAVRVHIHSDNGVDQKNFLISKKGGETVTKGKLDLDADGELDQMYPEDDPYGFKGGSLETVIYGEGSYESYKVDEVLTKIKEDNTLDLYDYDEQQRIGTTVASEGSFLTLTITIWIEGWHVFDSGNAIWSTKDYVTAQYNVGFQFAVETEAQLEE